MRELDAQRGDQELQRRHLGRRGRRRAAGEVRPTAASPSTGRTPASPRRPPTATSGWARSCAARSCSRPGSATSRSASARARPPGSTSARPPAGCTTRSTAADAPESSTETVEVRGRTSLGNIVIRRPMRGAQSAMLIARCAGIGFGGYHDMPTCDASSFSQSLAALAVPSTAAAQAVCVRCTAPRPGRSGACRRTSSSASTTGSVAIAPTSSRCWRRACGCAAMATPRPRRRRSATWSGARASSSGRRVSAISVATRRSRAGGTSGMTGRAGRMWRCSWPTIGEAPRGDQGPRGLTRARRALCGSATATASATGSPGGSDATRGHCGRRGSLWCSRTTGPAADRLVVPVVTRRSDHASYFAKRYGALVKTYRCSRREACVRAGSYEIAPDGLSLTVTWPDGAREA